MPAYERDISPAESATILLDGGPLDLARIDAVARANAPVALTEHARQRNERARESLRALIESGAQVYGATTGVGALRDQPVGEAQREALQWGLLRSHAVAAGPPLTVEQVRAGMLVRANQLGAGGAGVAPQLLDALVSALNARLTPVVRSIGSLGTGDLPELAQIALALMGEGEVWSDGGPVAVAAGLCAPRLGLRDALGFMSSNAVTIGRAALVCVDARSALRRWLTVAALSFQAVDADPGVFDARIADARGSECQAQVAARMRALLDGMQRGPGPHAVQDPYPFRVLAAVDALALETIARLERLVETEAGARCENALIIDGQALPNGNFHAAQLAGALDSLRAALAQSASLIAARVATLLDPRTSGLPAFLARRPGVDSGAMMLEYTAGAAAAQVRALALPLSVQTAGASLGVESHASLAANAVWLAEQALGALAVLVACELVVALRALTLAGRQPSAAGTVELFKRACAALPRELEDRQLGGDVDAAVSLLAAFPTQEEAVWQNPQSR